MKIVNSMIPPACSDGTAATESTPPWPALMSALAKLQVQVLEPAPDQAVDVLVRPRVRLVHLAEQAAAGHRRRVVGHAGRLVRMVGHLGRCALGRGPRRRRRGQREEGEADERQRDEAQRPPVEVGAAAQPQHRGRHVGQEEERDVAERDERLPPLHLRVEDVRLQPDGRFVAEEDRPCRCRPAGATRSACPASRRCRATGRRRSAPARTAGSRPPRAARCACRCSREQPDREPHQQVRPEVRDAALVDVLGEHADPHPDQPPTARRGRDRG